MCSDLDITWHFLGPVQSNKTRHIAENFDWIHSVDRLKTASGLNAQRPVDKAPLNVCLQVNIPYGETKSGLTTTSELVELASAIQQLERLSLRGIMAIPPPCADPHLQRSRERSCAHLEGGEAEPDGNQRGGPGATLAPPHRPACWGRCRWWYHNTTSTMYNDI